MHALLSTLDEMIFFVGIFHISSSFIFDFFCFRLCISVVLLLLLCFLVPQITSTHEISYRLHVWIHFCMTLYAYAVFFCCSHSIVYTSPNSDEHRFVRVSRRKWGQHVKFAINIIISVFDVMNMSFIYLLWNLVITIFLGNRICNEIACQHNVDDKHRVSFKLCV